MHQVHMSDFPPYTARVPNRTVSATAERRSVLGLGDTTHVEQVWEALQQQCEGGLLTAISAETTSHLGFGVWTDRVTFRGQCVQ